VLLQMRLRLSVMMFFEYFIWGVWYVTLGTWLGQQLHFSGTQIGLAAGTTALGAMISPFLVGLMADEWFATQRLLAALHGIGGVLLWVASAQTGFGPMYLILLIYSLCYMPTMALTNSLSFRQMKDPKQDFGSIRVLGTAGWIVAGLLIGFLRVESTATPIRLAGAAEVFRWWRIQAQQHFSCRSVRSLQRQKFLGFRSCILPDLHSAAVLLRVYQSVFE
jgi:MFS family permease